VRTSGGRVRWSLAAHSQPSSSPRDGAAASAIRVAAEPPLASRPCCPRWEIRSAHEPSHGGPLHEMAAWSTAGAARVQRRREKSATMPTAPAAIHQPKNRGWPFASHAEDASEALQDRLGVGAGLTSGWTSVARHRAPSAGRRPTPHRREMVGHEIHGLVRQAAKVLGIESRRRGQPRCGPVMIVPAPVGRFGGRAGARCRPSPSRGNRRRLVSRLANDGAVAGVVDAVARAQHVHHPSSVERSRPRSIARYSASPARARRTRPLHTPESSSASARTPRRANRREDAAPRPRDRARCRARRGAADERRRAPRRAAARCVSRPCDAVQHQPRSAPCSPLDLRASTGSPGARLHSWSERRRPSRSPRSRAPSRPCRPRRHPPLPSVARPVSTIEDIIPIVESSELACLPDVWCERLPERRRGATVAPRLASRVRLSRYCSGDVPTQPDPTRRR